MNYTTNLPVLENILAVMIERERTLKADLTGVRAEIKAMHDVISALAPPPPTYPTIDLGGSHRICVFSGKNGLVRFMTSITPVEQSFAHAAKTVGEIDYTRCAAFACGDHASYIKGVFNRLVEDHRLDAPSAYAAPAFDILLRALLSTAECLEISNFELWDTKPPMFNVIDGTPPSDDVLDNIEWALGRFVSQRGHGKWVEYVGDEQ